MRRAVAVCIAVLVFEACDPVWTVSASKPIAAPLDRTCVIETLRKQKSIQEAGIGATGHTYAILKVPNPLKSPESKPDVGVDEHTNSKGELELKLEMVWVGSKGSPEYQAYVQKVLDELRDQTIESCGGK